MDAQSIAVALAMLAGIAVGAFAAWRVARSSRAGEIDVAVANARAELAPEAAQLRERAAQFANSLDEARRQLESERRAREAAESDAAGLRTAQAQLDATLQGERKSAQEKLALLQEAEDKLANQFKVLANQILEEKSQKFADQNKTALGDLLEPLRRQLGEFKGKVEEVYVQEGKDRTALAEQVRQLMSLNKTLSQDAQNLTDALKGNAQVQGAWGEWVMEELLSSSGLMKDEHYLLQDSKRRDDGSRGRPDALINLPGGRQLVVDSKVSLVAYEQYTSAAGDDERAAALKAHLDSMKRHVGGLSDREYQKLYPTMDFVMMFIPIEPAFMLAAANDRQLFSHAWERNVLLVSPSTLLFVLRTVAYLWRQEDQNRNAQKIAERGAILFDKFCEFVKDLEALGQRLDQAQSAYGEARRKLETGRGNLISQAEKLTSLGVKGSKKIPAAFVQSAEPAAEVAEHLASLAASNTPRDTDAGPAA
ncbi:MAG TPA: DNA recombination protein RmuC [Ramlibacter sp.]